ncbi:MAG TPA: ABC transporter ATP-binding protein, partial [bacterium]|nr:ABC transporter ATP-binding protein [bacterium]
MAQQLLEVRNLTIKFGGLVAVNDVSFGVDAGMIKALIGPNGAGKTTIFNIVSGVYKPTLGQVFFKGVSIEKLPQHKIASLGLSRTFQNVQLFGNMTVLENVMVGCHAKFKSGMIGAVFRLPSMLSEERKIREMAAARLEAVGLEDSASLPAGSLPFGKQKALEIARALASEPDFLLLDEPAAGLNSAETVEIGKIIADLKKRGIT